MTPEAQRIAIAEACGWKRDTYSADCYRGEGWLDPRETKKSALHKGNCIAWRESELPNYLDDLNAMHEAEETLIIPQQLMFYRNLVESLDRNPDGSHRFGSCVFWETTHATATQRAEAFLRALNLWTD